MKLIAVLNNDETYAVDAIHSVLQGENCLIEAFILESQVGSVCTQSLELFQPINNADALVFIGSRNAQNNPCINYALQEAVRLGKKIICVRLDSGVELDPVFEGLGDELVHDFSGLTQAIFGGARGWEDEAGHGLDEKKLERFKCGNKK